MTGFWKKRHEIRRVVCMTEETTECFYRMGEEDRIVGISAFTVRPPRARDEKPVVSQFTKANIGEILALKPQMVLSFSDLQADICRELIGQGVEVHCFNQRSVAEILGMIRQLGGLIGVPEKGEALAAELESGLDRIAEAASGFPRRPRVYFEEWHDPMISGIRWVSELIEIAGGEDLFPEFRECALGKDRIIADPRTVIEREPEVYMASWCGRKFRRDYLDVRDGWADAPFLKADRVFEIESSIILQPGPASLTEGVEAIHRILAEVVGATPGVLAAKTGR